MRQYEYIELSQDERIFLKGYAPKEKHFTSLSEIKLVEDNLHITEHKDNLTALRNTVVQFYDELIGDGSDRNLTYAYMESMMSVTAVIDNYKYKY